MLTPLRANRLAARSRARWLPVAVLVATAALSTGCADHAAAPTAAPTCTTPSREATLIRVYQADSALTTPPREGSPATPVYQYVDRYCDVLDTTGPHPRPRSFTAVVNGYDATGFITVPDPAVSVLRQRYDPVLQPDGWSYVRQLEHGQPCQPLARTDPPSCYGIGVVFCKAVYGVTTELAIEATSSRVVIELSTNWAETSCPAPTTPPSA